MKQRKRIAVLASAAILTLSVSGAWAYFNMKKTVKLDVSPEKMSISIDESAFKLSTEPMVPGDLEPLCLSVTNEGNRDVKIAAEVTIQSKEPLDEDSIEWFIASDTLKNSFGDGEVIYSLPENTTEESVTLNNSKDTVQFLSKGAADANNEIHSVTFLVQGGRLPGKKSEGYESGKSLDLSFWLALASKTDNGFQGSSCSVTADVYAVQADHTDGIAWYKLKSSADTEKVGEAEVGTT